MAARTTALALPLVFLAIAAAPTLPDTVSGQAPPSITPSLLVSGLDEPVHVTHAGDGTDRLFIVEREGTIRIWNGSALLATPFLDITSQVGSSGQEQGLLGLAFSPDHTTDDRFYVYYTDTAGDSTLSRFEVSANPDVADPTSEEVLMEVPQPFDNHNAGMLAFRDGLLYVAFGDGGLAADPALNAQNLASILGKILRIDVSAAVGYTIPPDNPFVDVPLARGEIWAYGLRNPWRFSFDSLTDDLYIGDVGQFQIEEIDFEAASDPGGRNYGWNIFEGHGIHSTGITVPVEPPGFTFPVHEYDHSLGCSVTGGYVYRGTDTPSLAGTYLFGDFCSGIIWGMTPGTWSVSTLATTSMLIASFGEDEDGELYAVDLAGAVYALT